ncbi:MAG: hypothetical protein ACD_51C00300G0001 [uncultured bacterium]|nr:MAG: hypothetical protein ACD_51C00300G0001 [uncultured bacterium]OGJ46978.1 MAG: hypothetical protein A2244_04525 [Candidatus Peregrinibacteria bacterium RIFOXYA2_FULL_41_18]OGJ49396.1 MAG: hypothetical protein A2344_03140 [Candidatus Peregrinibacteria bacterium RIFOXYB12_FULL_41_12]OGJ52989.1 MAG: hypothetical protein A2336_04080 [Candidatus Peregrinibacteria bacterium RIFOXYB2_FULL_41_88]OGJ53627.1 MAG: hypothetical protein A2448_01685 [Candidatus Peregrinibacteria bacterium RIFOXYC2_FULL
MSENSYTTREVMQNQVIPALRSVMRNANVDGEVRSLLNNPTLATDSLKQSVADRYLAPFFGKDKDAQLLLLNEMLKTASTKEKLELLKDFLEGIPAYGGGFDPKKFLENTSRKVAERVKPKISGFITQNDENSVERAVGNQEREDAELEKEVGSMQSTQTTFKFDPNKIELPIEQKVAVPFPPLPILPPPPIPQMSPEESYVKNQVEGAKIKVPETPKEPVKNEIPATPMAAENERAKKYNKGVDEVGEEVAKDASKAAEKSGQTVTTQTKNKKTIMSRIMSPTGIGVLTGLGTGGVVGGIFGLELIS